MLKVENSKYKCTSGQARLIWNKEAAFKLTNSLDQFKTDAIIRVKQLMFDEGLLFHFLTKMGFG